VQEQALGSEGFQLLSVFAEFTVNELGHCLVDICTDNASSLYLVLWDLATWLNLYVLQGKLLIDS
jgi:hypothetical protein